MFGRIIRRSVPLPGICRSCNKNLHKLQNGVKLVTYHKPSEKRYISYSCSLYSNKTNTREKYEEKESEETEDKGSKGTKEKDTEKESENQFESQNEGKKPENEESDHKYEQKKEYSGIYGKDLVLHSFINAEKKEKDTFLECLRMYKNQPGRKRERVPFLYAALKYMDDFGVNKDLSVYKALIDIFPKEKMIPQNQFQTMFMHYPKEQYCATAILEKMEDNGVIPDPEMESQLLNIFGRHGMPLEKYWKMMYWMPKFKNLNPWPVPKPIPDDVLELAKLAMHKISSIDVESIVTIMDTNDVKDSIDKTWIVSAMAPKQSELLVKHDKKTPIYVEGPFKIYVATKCVDYFTLRADPIVDRKFPEIDDDAVDKIDNPYVAKPTSDIILPPLIHEQIDSTIFANCATGSSTKDSLLSWIRLLQKDNPVLAEIPIVFTLRNYTNERYYIEDGLDKQIPDDKKDRQIPEDKDNDDKFLK